MTSFSSGTHPMALPDQAGSFRRTVMFQSDQKVCESGSPHGAFTAMALHHKTTVAAAQGTGASTLAQASGLEECLHAG
ncbi:hypothetical protein AOLI_G00109610 [Acnodon oligacanthus]